MAKKAVDFLVVGSGFYGAVVAERIANVLNKKVCVLESRNHIGGNCYSETHKETGVEYHKYGTHIFHTSIKAVWDYLQNFTELNSYHHQVLTTHKGKVFQMPINLETINSFFEVGLKPYEVEGFLKDEIEAAGINVPENLEEKAISLIGERLYEAFIKGYTMKQWKKDPKELPAAIINRLPVRSNYCEDYFVNCRWQGIPVKGYTEIFNRMFDSANITTEMGADYFRVRDEYDVKYKTIYTGPIDRFFDYKYGHLDWRSVKFKFETQPYEDWQGTSVMNYADYEVPYTRIHEPKHLHPEREYQKDSTLTIYEYPEDNPNDPYYPVNTQENKQMASKYKELAKAQEDVIIGGRLGDYAYYDMDMTINAALKTFEKKIQPLVR